MIRGKIRPDRGTILLEGTDIVKRMRSARKYLGGTYSVSVHTHLSTNIL